MKKKHHRKITSNGITFKLVALALALATFLFVLSIAPYYTTRKDEERMKNQKSINVQELIDVYKSGDYDAMYKLHSESFRKNVSQKELLDYWKNTLNVQSTTTFRIQPPLGSPQTYLQYPINTNTNNSPDAFDIYVKENLLDNGEHFWLIYGYQHKWQFFGASQSELHGE